MKTTSDTSQLLLNAIAQSRQVFFLTDSAGTIIYVNKAFEELTGYTFSEIGGKSASILKSGEHTKEFYKEMWDTIRSGQSWSGRIKNKKKDGSLYTEEITISPLQDANGKPTHFLASLRDITKELTLEAEFNHCQRLESLGLLSGQIAHDFNNLLTIIIGSMELIIEDLKDSADTKKLAQDMLKTAKSSAALIKQLLVFARKQSNAPRSVEVADILNDNRAMLTSAAGQNIELTYNFTGTAHPVLLDPEQFTQVLLNLVINAKDAMPTGGAIDISVCGLTVSAKDLLPLKPGDYTIIEVSDTGAGISKEIIGRIFEPFFTTKPKGRGTGLGLSTAYGIIKQNNGAILVDSIPGNGTTFHIYLPATKMGPSK